MLYVTLFGLRNEHTLQVYSIVCRKKENGETYCGYGRVANFPRPRVTRWARCPVKIPGSDFLSFSRRECNQYMEALFGAVEQRAFLPSTIVTDWDGWYPSDPEAVSNRKSK